MKITLSGSLGRIGKPLTEKLVEQGHTVTVISSSSERSTEIKDLGAIPAIGNLKDTTFLTSAFDGADSVYAMVPPADYFDKSLVLMDYFKSFGHAFAKAVKDSKVKRVVNLSSIGAHLKEGNGILEGTYYVEKSLNALPDSVFVTHVRPVEIYYNLFQFIDLIKHQGIIGSNLAKDTFNAWVSPQDIANVVAAELTKSGNNEEVRYVASDELTYDELASTIGSAIGKSDLEWVQFSDKDVIANLTNVGFNPTIAEQIAEMYKAIRTGLLYENYHKNKPESFGSVKISDFAKDFAMAYRNK